MLLLSGSVLCSVHSLYSIVSLIINFFFGFCFYIMKIERKKKKNAKSRRRTKTQIMSKWYDDQIDDKYSVHNSCFIRLQKSPPTFPPIHTHFNIYNTYFSFSSFYTLYTFNIYWAIFINIQFFLLLCFLLQSSYSFFHFFFHSTVHNLFEWTIRHWLVVP